MTFIIFRPCLARVKAHCAMGQQLFVSVRFYKKMGQSRHWVVIHEPYPFADMRAKGCRWLVLWLTFAVS